MNTGTAGSSDSYRNIYGCEYAYTSITLQVLGHTLYKSVFSLLTHSRLLYVYR